LQGSGFRRTALNDGEDGGVGADAEGKREDGDRGGARGFPKHSEAEAQILYEVLNPIYTSFVTAFLLGLLDTSQVESSATVRFGLRHPLRNEFLSFSFEMVSQLVV
jgi:hypothetical protein